MIKTGLEIVYKMDGEYISPINYDLGQTDILHVNGRFQVWRSRSISVWDARSKERIVQPAEYRIVKRIAPTFALVGGRFTRCRRVLVMRFVIANVSGWRGVRDELILQVDMLAHRNLREGDIE